MGRVFAREGAKAFIIGRTQAKLDRVARDIAAASGAVETAQVDALDEAAVEEHFASVVSRSGRVEVTILMSPM